LKKFIAPKMDVEKFDISDVVSTSGETCWEDCPGDTYSCPNVLGS